MKSFKDLSPEVVTDYASESADMVMQLSTILHKHIEDNKMVELLEEVEFPLIGILADIELAGVNLDTQMLNDYSVKLADQISTLRSAILESAGVEFNVDSPRQLGEVLFDNLQLSAKQKRQRPVNTKPERTS